MTDRSPSEVLTAAADLIRDRAAVATEGPWESGDRCVWQVGAVDVEDFVVSDGDEGDGGCRTIEDAEWITLLNPAVAPHLEAILRRALGEYDADQPHRTMRMHNSHGQMGGWHVSVSAMAALDLARSLLSQVDTKEEK